MINNNISRVFLGLKIFVCYYNMNECRVAGRCILFNRPFNTQIRFKFDLLKHPYLRFLKQNNEIL